ncbi:aminodeoxychorismate lyase [Halonotius terrestris]|uniref:Aminodeoxychorismate lyase n=1 Tax=Halonotius terrestris TaxID=2487750 RepID=A0A8J8P9C4_9EURY|nr:aminotransferase class IV [Halonotius terrestris]TQQ83443.1 aminodeoxychorismate lyase [Halonotius terrestris]
MTDPDSNNLVYHVDGELVPADEASVNVADRGFLYGDAAFETMRAYGGEVFAWEAHADRLQKTCSVLGLKHGLATDDLHGRIEETLAANDLSEAYVRLSITRGVQPGKLTPDETVDPTVVVIVKPLPRGGSDGQPVWDEPATLQTVKTKRVPDAAIPARAKTHNYLNGILARLELRVSDADEAIMVDTDGHVAEGATSNLFFVRDNALRTPSLDGPVLPGITRRVVLDIAEEEGIPVEEGQYTPDEIRNADEVFFTNSTWEIRPVDIVDGIRIGDDAGSDDSNDAGNDGNDDSNNETAGSTAAGPITTLLSRLFDARIDREYYD